MLAGFKSLWVALSLYIAFIPSTISANIIYASYSGAPYL